MEEALVSRRAPGSLPYNECPKQSNGAAAGAGEKRRRSASSPAPGAPAALERRRLASLDE
jgi:hypothetical protein